GQQGAPCLLRCKDKNPFAELPQRAHGYEPGTVRLAESSARPADDRRCGSTASRAGKTIEFTKSTPTQIPADAGDLSHRQGNAHRASPAALRTSKDRYHHA